MLETIKKNGMRKMAWGLIALIAIFVLALAGKLGDSIFRDCFVALVGFVMGANYGEHKEKKKAEIAAPAPGVTP